MGHLGNRCEDSLAILYSRYSARVLGLARKIVRDPHRAEEVLQDVFTALWTHPDRYEQRRGSLTVWLLTIAHHRSVDVVRRERRYDPMSPEDVVQELPATDPSLDDQLIATIEADQVRVALRALSENSRHAIVLAYFGGYTQSEIATLTGIPLGTVKSRMRHAMRSLHAALGDDGLRVNLAT